MMKPIMKICLLMLLLGGWLLPAFSQEGSHNWEKVVFHLDDSSNARWAILLARSLIEDNPKAKVTMVSYGPGIDFLLLDAKDARGNPYDPAVMSLAEKGVNFRVCASTLSARKISREDVLDVVEIVPSGVSEIIRLQNKEGYAYLKP